MFDKSRLNQKFRPSPSFRRKRPGLQSQKRVEPPINIPRLIHAGSRSAYPFKTQILNVPPPQLKPAPSTRKPTPTFTSKGIVPTFTSYNKPKTRLTRPTVRPTRTLNKIPTKSMLSPRHSPDTPESGFVSQEPTSVALKIKTKKTISTRHKRKLSHRDDDYRPKIKRRRIRKPPPHPSHLPAKVEEPNYSWRDKEKISVPDIFVITQDEWPSDDDDFHETAEDITDEAYYIRHFRAEQRERIFYQKLQKWRDKEEKSSKAKEVKSEKLRVADRPRGPWQVKLPKSINRGPLHIPPEITAEPTFNYVWRGKWTQPVRWIRRHVIKEPEGPRTRNRHGGGKELGYHNYGLIFT